MDSLYSAFNSGTLESFVDSVYAENTIGAIATAEAISLLSGTQRNDHIDGFYDALCLRYNARVLASEGAWEARLHAAKTVIQVLTKHHGRPMLHSGVLIGLEPLLDPMITLGEECCVSSGSVDFVRFGRVLHGITLIHVFISELNQALISLPEFLVQRWNALNLRAYALGIAPRGKTMPNVLDESLALKQGIPLTPGDTATSHHLITRFTAISKMLAGISANPKASLGDTLGCCAAESDMQFLALLVVRQHLYSDLAALLGDADEDISGMAALIIVRVGHTIRLVDPADPIGSHPCVPQYSKATTKTQLEFIFQLLDRPDLLDADISSSSTHHTWMGALCQVVTGWNSTSTGEKTFALNKIYYQLDPPISLIFALCRLLFLLCESKGAANKDLSIGKILSYQSPPSPLQRCKIEPSKLDEKYLPAQLGDNEAVAMAARERSHVIVSVLGIIRQQIEHTHTFLQGDVTDGLLNVVFAALLGSYSYAIINDDIGTVEMVKSTLELCTKVFSNGAHVLIEMLSQLSEESLRFVGIFAAVFNQLIDTTSFYGCEFYFNNYLSRWGETPSFEISQLRGKFNESLVTRLSASGEH